MRLLRILMFLAATVLNSSVLFAAQTTDKLPDSYWKSPIGREHEKLCGKSSSQFKGTVTAPTCSAYLLGVGTGTETQIYIQTYKEDCNSQKCWFKSARKACIARTFVESQTDTEGLAKPFCPVFDYNKYQQNYSCSYCADKEIPKCAGGRVLSGLVCPSRGIVISREQIDSVDYEDFCGTDIQGPYKNFNENSYQACLTTQTTEHAGMIFSTDQREQIKRINRAKHGGKLRSDLAGFCYRPAAGAKCNKYLRGSNTICQEPEALQGVAYKPNSAEVHHIIPKADRNGCACGANEMKNAVVISKQLNAFFSNRDRFGKVSECPKAGMSELMNEIQWINTLEAYPGVANR